MDEVSQAGYAVGASAAQNLAQIAASLPMGSSLSPYGVVTPTQGKSPSLGLGWASMLFSGLPGRLGGQRVAPGSATSGPPGSGLGLAALVVGGGLFAALGLLGLMRREEMKTKDMVAMMAANLLAGPVYQKRLLEAADFEAADKVVKSAVAVAERILDVAAEFETDEVQKKRGEIEKKLRDATQELEDVKRDLADALKSKVDATKGKLGEALDTLHGKPQAPASPPATPPSP